MNVIFNFENPENATWVTWDCAGKKIKLTSKGRLLAALSPGDNVLVVKIERHYGKNNAFLYSPDGSLIKQVENDVENSICFDDVCFDGSELVLIAGSERGRVACVINEFGEVVRKYNSV